MKLFISCDMEGISGVSVTRQCRPDDSEYQRMRKVYTAEVNAAVKAAFAAGAQKVTVADGHGPMTNLLVEEMDERVEVVAGITRPLCQMQGIEDGYDACAFIGYHAAEGNSPGVLNHSVLGAIVNQIRLNGQPIGETGLNATLAGYFSVPVVVVSGDDVLVAEARQWVPDVLGVPVKKAITRYSAQVQTPKSAQEKIAAAITDALQNLDQFHAVQVPEQTTFQVDFKASISAEMASLFPCVKHVGGKTIEVSASSYLAAYRLLWGSLIMGYATHTPIM